MMFIRQGIGLISASEKQGIILPQRWLKRLFSRLGIRQKIVYGYALAIGIAIMGATTGKIFENYYQEQAKKQLTNSQELTSLLNTLQASVLQAHTQTPKLFSLLKEPIRLELEYSRFLEYIAAVNRLLHQTKSIIDSKIASSNQDSFQTLESNKELKRSLQAYINSIQDYSQRLEAIFQEAEPITVEPQTVQSKQLSIVNLQSRQIDLQINKVSREMSSLIADIQNKEAQKTVQALDKARDIGNLILIISLLSAVVIAATLAIYTSRVIAHPIEVTTKIAKQVTEEANFTLQAPVTTEDEVGLLTTSLNQLIQRVAEYTQDLKQAQAQLIQTEKMSSLGQMVAGIAHEINNPVSFIYGNIEHTKEYTEDLLKVANLCKHHYSKLPLEIQEELDAIELDFLTDDLPKMLSSMKIGAERIRQLVLSLRNFSRLDESEVKDVDLHEGIESTLLILNNRLKDKVEIIKQYGQVPLVKCYPAQLNQVFMNILSNAIDALLTSTKESPKQIVIETSPVAAKINAEITSVVVKIRDNGSGIPAEVQTKIFDPFFTTKPVGSGTGLGLSISYQIVEKHGGEILVNSKVGEGTEFAIALPVKQQIPST
jgi:two-component system NtrC family sensor kinase